MKKRLPVLSLIAFIYTFLFSCAGVNTVDNIEACDDEIIQSMIDRSPEGQTITLEDRTYYLCRSLDIRGKHDLTLLGSSDRNFRR